MKIIKNNVVWSTYLKRTELKNFQWNLKQEDVQANKILQESIKKWFDAPIYVRYENENYILDWHQRLIALNSLQEKWYMLEDDKVPVVYIKAETVEEAKQKVGEYNSSFADMNMDFAHDFFNWIDLSNTNIEWFAIDTEWVGEEEKKQEWEETKYAKEFFLQIKCINEAEQQSIYDSIIENWIVEPDSIKIQNI